MKKKKKKKKKKQMQETDMSVQTDSCSGMYVCMYVCMYHIHHCNR